MSVQGYGYTVPPASETQSNLRVRISSMYKLHAIITAGSSIIHSHTVIPAVHTFLSAVSAIRGHMASWLLPQLVWKSVLKMYNPCLDTGVYSVYCWQWVTAGLDVQYFVMCGFD